MITIKYSLLVTTLFSLSLFGSAEIEPTNFSEEASSPVDKKDASNETEYEPINQDDVGEAVENEKSNNSLWIAGLSLTGLVSVVAAIISSKLKSIEKDIKIKKRAAWGKLYSSCENFPDFKKFMIQQIENENYYYYMENETNYRSVMFKDSYGEPYLAGEGYSKTNLAINKFIKITNCTAPEKKDSSVRLKKALLAYVKGKDTPLDEHNTDSKESRSLDEIKADIKCLNSEFVYKIVSRCALSDFSDEHMNEGNHFDCYFYTKDLHNLYLELEKANKIDAQKCYENELAQLNKECEAEKAKVWPLSFSSKKSVK